MAKPNNNTLYKNCVEPFLPDMSGSGGGSTVLYSYWAETYQNDAKPLFYDPEYTKPVPNSEIPKMFEQGLVVKYQYNGLDANNYSWLRPYECRESGYISCYNYHEDQDFQGVDE